MNSHPLEKAGEIKHLSEDGQWQKGIENTKKGFVFMNDSLNELNDMLNFKDYKKLDLNKFNESYNNFFDLVDDFNNNQDKANEIEKLAKDFSKFNNDLKKKINIISKNMNRIKVELTKHNNMVPNENLNTPQRLALEHIKAKRQQISRRLSKRNSSSKKNFK